MRFAVDSVGRAAETRAITCGVSCFVNNILIVAACTGTAMASQVDQAAVLGFKTRRLEAAGVDYPPKLVRGNYLQIDLVGGPLLSYRHMGSAWLVVEWGGGLLTVEREPPLMNCPLIFVVLLTPYR